VWYYRDFRSEEIVGPFFYGVANEQARRYSEDNDSGLAELMVEGPNGLEVYYTYVRGRQTLRGKAARDASAHNKPPYL